MKAVVLNAEWAPRQGAEIDPKDAARRWAVNANQVYKNPEATYETVDDPGEPGPRELVLKVGACGICGSDVHMFETDDDGYMFLPYHLATPVVTGHEFSGKVVAVGSAVTEFKVDDLVTAEEIQWCGECDACRGGYWNNCRFIEDLGFTIDGGFAEYVKVPAKACWSLNAVLERYGDEKTALEVGSMSEPTSVAYEGMFTRAGGFLPGRAVAVFGGGPIGLASVALAKAGGASKVFCLEPLPERREVAAKLGATHPINPLEVDAVEAIMEETKGDGVALAVEASGNFPAVMRTIERSLGIGGKVSIIGLDPRAAEVNFVDYQLKAGSIYGSIGHSGSWDFPNVIKLMASGQIDMHHAITKRFALAELVAAIDETKTRVDGKILVKSEL
ncbi:MAG: alcohol dehydrogenase catalytic domain-containing protein [Actinobacteria bacterium]|nr:alcohol dehydrogenase catalytic domain-containing protein [Actinomycetota bacterium]